MDTKADTLKAKHWRKYEISEARILQINNDIAEQMGTYTKRELVEVVKYYADRLYDAHQQMNETKDEVLLDLLKRITPIDPK